MAATPCSSQPSGRLLLEATSKAQAAWAAADRLKSLEIYRTVLGTTKRPLLPREGHPRGEVVELTGINRTWGSAYLSAWRTYRLGVLSAGRSAGRKYGLIRHPPLVLAEKMAGGTAVPSASRLGRPKVQPYLRPADRPAESTV